MKTLRKFRNLFNSFANHCSVCTLRSPATLKQEGVTVNLIKEGYAQLSPSTTNRLIMQLCSKMYRAKKTVNLPTFMQPFIYSLLYRKRIILTTAGVHHLDLLQLSNYHDKTVFCLLSFVSKSTRVVYYVMVVSGIIFQSFRKRNVTECSFDVWCKLRPML